MKDFFYDSYQFILFFVIPGVFLGAIYDVFRILRIARLNTQGTVISGIYEHFKIQKRHCRPKTKKSGFILVFIEDIFFCIIAALTEILLFYHLNDGVIRIYAISLSLIGFLVYRNSIGRFVVFIAKQIICLARNIIYYTLIIILTPPVLIYRSGKSVLKKIFLCKMRKK